MPRPERAPRCIKPLGSGVCVGGIVTVGGMVAVGEIVAVGGVVEDGDAVAVGGGSGAVPRAAAAFTIPPVTVIPLSEATWRTLFNMDVRTCW